MTKKHHCNENWGFATKAVHVGSDPCPTTGALAAPIYQTSTFVFESAEQGARRFAGEEEGYIYTRLGNPSQRALELKIASLEGADDAIVVGSGIAAVSGVIFSLTKQGDHVVSSDSIYGCSHSFLSHVISDYGINTTFVDVTNLEKIEAAIQENTKVIYIESPANPTLTITDIECVVALSKKYGCKVVIDNTFASPYLQNPLKMGVDVVLHSATKYINGHGDVIAGIILGDQEFIDGCRGRAIKDIGGVISPFNCFLISRGLKTLPIRMEKTCDNAMKIAEYLESHPKVERVFYPGLKSHPQHDLAKKQMRGFGGIIAFELEGGLEAGKILMNSVEMLKLAVSLGDLDTLMQHPASMTHAVIPHEERLAAGITDGLVRISAGIEDVEDIIADLEQALAKL
ncbi:MAG: methionine gamma-lyase [Halanaerobiales bacterium]|nr:methionine gamma-lyase [Halanaerobiales bacterium]